MRRAGKPESEQGESQLLSLEEEERGEECEEDGEGCEPLPTCRRLRSRENSLLCPWWSSAGDGGKVWWKEAGEDVPDEAEEGRLKDRSMGSVCMSSGGGDSTVPDNLGMVAGDGAFTSAKGDARFLPKGLG